MSASWRHSFPAEELEVFERAGFGRSEGLGRRPALLVIDVQYRTVGEEPLPVLDSIERFYPTSCGEHGWAAVPQIERLIAAAREAGTPVVYPHVAPKVAADAGRSAGKIPGLMQVTGRGYEFVEEVAPQQGDLLVPKRHPSAFFGTALTSYLVDLEVDTVVLTGCTTSGCVRATAVDAYAYNFHCAVVEDAVYDRSPTSHDRNLFEIDAKYGDVMSADSVAEYLVGTGRPTAVAR